MKINTSAYWGNFYRLKSQQKISEQKVNTTVNTDTIVNDVNESKFNGQKTAIENVNVKNVVKDMMDGNVKSAPPKTVTPQQVDSILKGSNERFK